MSEHYQVILFLGLLEEKELRLRSLRRGCPVLGPQQFLLAYGKRRLQWIIDYGKHLYAAYLVCFGREPSHSELWEIMERFIRYKPSKITSRVVTAVMREAKRTPELIQRFYLEPFFTLQVADRILPLEAVKGLVSSAPRG